MKIFNILFGKYKYITMTAIIAALIVGIITVLLCLYSSSSKDDSELPDRQSEIQSQADVADGTLSGDSCILLVCNSEKIGEAMFMTLVDFHIFAENIVITPLDMTVSDGNKTYAENYSYGGINDLIKSVETVRDCQIDRYVIIDKNGMSELTDIMGKVNIYVTEDYTYEASDKSYAVSAGQNELESDMLYGYLKIVSQHKNGVNNIADLLCTIVNSYLSAVNVDEAQNLFGKLCNCVNTDITISDYYTCNTDIEYLLTHNAKCIVFDKGE